ncbi:MAG: ABC transporter permease [Xanthomonadales bacterium]|nr:ABC transporter permease [Xanthomonadales bacterium]
MMGVIAENLRHAARSLAQSPGFTASTVLMLGLAIGAVSGVFSVVNAVLLEPWPYREPQRLVQVLGSAPGSQFPAQFGVAPEFFVHWRERSTLIESLSTTNSFTNTARLGERAERLRMSSPTQSLFETLGVQPKLGRLPAASDDQPVVLLSDTMWADWFARDPAVLGRSIELFGAQRSIIGVMGPDFRFPADGTMLWLANRIEASDIEQPGRFGNAEVARLVPGATPEQLADELTALARELPERFGGTANYARLIEQFRAVVRPLDEAVLGAYTRPLWVLLAATGIVLLIACANVGNLFLVRGEARHREMALRHALGANRGQLLALLCSEAFIVAVLAGACAILLSTLCMPLLLRAAPAGLPRLDQVGVDGTVLAATFGTAMLSALLCGLIPALRLSSPDLERLRSGGRGSTAGRSALRQALVALQSALALVLLIGSGLLLRSVHALSEVDSGFDPQDVFTFQIAPERPELDSAEAFARFHLRFRDRLAALPGVQTVGIIENVPIDEGTQIVRTFIEGQDVQTSEGAILNMTFSAGDYFQAMRIPLLQGRLFTDDDQLRGSGNVLLGRAAAELLWPGQDPIGRRLLRQGQDHWETVVGVVGDVRQNGPQNPADAMIYLPLVGPDPTTAPRLSSPAYVVKSRRANSLSGEIRALVREVAPEAPMYREYLMEDLVSSAKLQLTFTLLTLGIAAGLALLLGAAGLYGVLSYINVQRTREIGLRIALGAGAQRVRRQVMAQGVRVVALGIAIGLVVAAAGSGTLGDLLFGVEPLDAPTFFGTATLLALVGLMAAYLPARRASRMSPMEALRYD